MSIAQRSGNTQIEKCALDLVTDFCEGSDISVGVGGWVEASFLNVDEQTECKDLETGEVEKY